MQKPITEEQLMNLIAEYGKEAVMKKCEALENKKDAAKKYKSAYMTLKSWLRDFPDIREAKKQSNEDKVKKAMEILQSGTQLIPEFK
jgi:N-methylhydantoinase B/oxoprolinase/acetone carboxylase alpha subunit